MIQADVHVMIWVQALFWSFTCGLVLLGMLTGLKSRIFVERNGRAKIVWRPAIIGLSVSIAAGTLFWGIGNLIGMMLGGHPFGM